MKDEFTQENFFKALKIDKDTPLCFLYEGFFHIIDENKEYIDEIWLKDYSYDSYEEFLERQFNKSIVKELLRLINGKRKVYTGVFSDDVNNSLENYLSYSSFFLLKMKIFF
jgi:hypothetical protein